VTANLAVALAAGGQQVVVVDGDLRRPTVAETFGLVEGAGLTDVLIGRAEVEDVLQPWGAGGRLRILPAGAVPPNPSELLGSKAMRKLLTDLAEDAIVIIDTPPLLPVTDAAVLAASTDGAIVVTEAGKTRLDELARAVAHIADVQARTLGVVLNKVPKTSVDASYYGTYTPTEK
jgi:capsular exopolysaccharide synthesis family protein